MSLEDFLCKLDNAPETVEFTETIEVIDQYYLYTKTAFQNGMVSNAAGENEGSCKILAFGLLNQLSIDATLHCFGHYYRDEVLNDPDGDSHQNIRQFMQQGWQGVNFEQAALRK